MNQNMYDRLWSLIPALRIDGRVLHTRHPKRKPESNLVYQFKKKTNRIPSTRITPLEKW